MRLEEKVKLSYFKLNKFHFFKIHILISSSIKNAADTGLKFSLCGILLPNSQFLKTARVKTSPCLKFHVAPP